MLVAHGPQAKTLWVVHIHWGKPRNKSLRLPLSNVGEKGEETPKIMVLGSHDHDVGVTWSVMNKDLKNP